MWARVCGLVVVNGQAREAGVSRWKAGGCLVGDSPGERGRERTAQSGRISALLRRWSPSHVWQGHQKGRQEERVPRAN